MLKSEGARRDITFLSTCAPTADSKEKDKDSFYGCLAKTIEEEKGNILYIGGEFNARLYERQTHEKEEIGKHIIERKRYLLDGITENTRDNRNRFMEFLKTYDCTALNT